MNSKYLSNLKNKNDNALNCVFISECMNYKSLTDPTRKLNFPTGTGNEADSLGYRPRSVDWQGEAWYRVMGNAGTRIPEDPFTSVQLLRWL